MRAAKRALLLLISARWAVVRVLMLVLSPILTLLIYWMEWPKVWYVVPAAFTLWLTFDAVVLHRYLETISFFRHKEGLDPGEFQQSYFKGVSRASLKERVNRYTKIIHDMEKQAVEAPCFQEESVRDSLRKRGLERTLRLLPKPPPPTLFGE